jgi:hypothetical protein
MRMSGVSASRMPQGADVTDGGRWTLEPDVCSFENLDNNPVRSVLGNVTRARLTRRGSDADDLAAVIDTLDLRNTP